VLAGCARGYKHGANITFWAFNQVYHNDSGVG
jgi:hypothetical protein